MRVPASRHVLGETWILTRLLGGGGKQESDRVYPLRSYRVLARGVRGQLLSQE